MEQEIPSALARPPASPPDDTYTEIIHVYQSRCWPCSLDRHYAPAAFHTWADDLDLMASNDPTRTAQELCACPCATPTTKTED